MKRLLKSSKFWLSVIGSLFAVISYVVTGSETLAIMILGAFGLGIAGNTAEDVFKNYKSIPGGGIPNPPKEEEDEDN